MAATGRKRRVARVVPLLAATLAIGSGGNRGDGGGPAPAGAAEGGSLALACAAIHLFVCGPWWPVCPKLPSACHPGFPPFDF